MGICGSGGAEELPDTSRASESWGIDRASGDDKDNGVGRRQRGNGASKGFP